MVFPRRAGPFAFLRAQHPTARGIQKLQLTLFEAPIQVERRLREPCPLRQFAKGRMADVAGTLTVVVDGVIRNAEYGRGFATPADHFGEDHDLDADLPPL